MSTHPHILIISHNRPIHLHRLLRSLSGHPLTLSFDHPTTPMGCSPHHYQALNIAFQHHTHLIVLCDDLEVSPHYPHIMCTLLTQHPNALVNTSATFPFDTATKQSRAYHYRTHLLSGDNFALSRSTWFTLQPHIAAFLSTPDRRAWFTSHNRPTTTGTSIDAALETACFTTHTPIISLEVNRLINTGAYLDTNPTPHYMVTGTTLDPLPTDTTFNPALLTKGTEPTYIHPFNTNP